MSPVLFAGTRPPSNARDSLGLLVHRENDETLECGDTIGTCGPQTQNGTSKRDRVEPDLVRFLCRPNLPSRKPADAHQPELRDSEFLHNRKQPRTSSWPTPTPCALPVISESFLWSDPRAADGDCHISRVSGIHSPFVDGSARSLGMGLCRNRFHSCGRK